MTFRDRFFTSKTGRAILSWRILLGAAGGVAAALLGVPIWASIAIGIGVYLVSVALAMPRAPKLPAIDPFTVSEPWRHFVKDAQRSRQQLLTTVRSTPSGPLRDRLQSIFDRLDTGLAQGWQIAKRGDEIDAAVKAGQMASAEQLALQSRASADLAAAKTASVKALAVNAEMKASNAALAQELNRNTGERK